jgi:hypothetical protein
MERIHRRLYNWSVAVPFVEGLTFSTTAAIWVITLLSAFALVVLQNSLSLAVSARETDTGQPWLLLDAEGPLERAIAFLWLLSIPLSGLLISSALILATSETFRVTGANVPTALIFATLSAILAVTAVNIRTAVTCSFAIVRLRRRRTAAVELLSVHESKRPGEL